MICFDFFFFFFFFLKEERVAERLMFWSSQEIGLKNKIVPVSVASIVCFYFKRIAMNRKWLPILRRETNKNSENEASE